MVCFSNILIHPRVSVPLLGFQNLIGLDDGKFQQLKAWSATRAVRLRFTCEHRCQYDHEEKKDVVDPVKRELDHSLLGKATIKTITTVTTHFWRVNNKWEIFAFAGTDPNTKVSSLNYSSEMILSLALYTHKRFFSPPRIFIFFPTNHNRP